MWSLQTIIRILIYVVLFRCPPAVLRGLGVRGGVLAGPTPASRGRERVVRLPRAFVNRAAIAVVAAGGVRCSERNLPPRGRQPPSELEEILAQVQQYLAGVSGRPDHRPRRRRGGADLPVVELVHGPAGRDRGRATLWQGRAHGRAGLALQVALWDRDGAPGAHGPRAQGGVRLPVAGHCPRPAHAIYG